MGNDGGRRQWWGLEEGEGVVCWASHFVRGPSIFVRAQSFRSCAVVLIRARASSSFKPLWWTVSAGRSSCRLSGVVVSAGARRLWVGARCRPWVEDRLWGGHHHPGWGYRRPWMGHRLPWVGLVVVCR